MTREQEFFLQILADYLHERATNTPDGLDWSQISVYAKNHEVGGIVGYQCGSYLKRHPELEHFRSRFDRAAAASLFFYENKKWEFEQLKAAFQTEHIRFFSIKGLEVAELYPVPALRTMGDLDIVLSTGDRERAHAQMIRMGYHMKSDECEWSYAKADAVVELHDRLVYDEKMESEARRNYFNDCWAHIASDDNGWCKLDWNFHFLFLIEHLARHFNSYGIGFRQFLDIAVVARRQNLDWQWLEKELREIDLWDFTCTLFSFCRRWWGVEPPISAAPPDDAFFEESTELVFKNGVFGFSNEDFRVNSAGKQFAAVRAPKPLRPLIVAVKKVCRPYRVMVTYPYCKFLAGRRWLLPAAWVYRIFYVAVHNKERLRAERDVVFGATDRVEKHSDLMRRWGL